MNTYDRYIIGLMFKLIMRTLFFLAGFAIKVPTPEGYWKVQYRELSDDYVRLITKINDTWNIDEEEQS